MKDPNTWNPVDPRVQNRATMMRVGLLFAVAMLIASTMQPVFVAGTLSTMLFFASIGAAVAALLLREKPLGHDHLTRWDEAAMLILLSLVAGMFADPEAMRTAMQEQQNAANVGSAAGEASSAG